jgi:hypothetical protein
MPLPAYTVVSTQDTATLKGSGDVGTIYGLRGVGTSLEVQLRMHGSDDLRWYSPDLLDPQAWIQEVLRVTLRNEGPGGPWTEALLAYHLGSLEGKTLQVRAQELSKAEQALSPDDPKRAREHWTRLRDFLLG